MVATSPAFLAEPLQKRKGTLLTMYVNGEDLTCLSASLASLFLAIRFPFSHFSVTSSKLCVSKDSERGMNATCHKDNERET